MSGTPRVLVVTLGRRGGLNRYGYLMTRALARNSDVAVVYSSAAENATEWQELTIPRLSVKTFSSVPGLLLSFLAFARFSRIRSFAKAFHPDIVYYPGGHAWKPLLDIVLPRGNKVVLTLHDPILHAGEDSLAHRLLDRVNRQNVDGFVLLNRSQCAEFTRRNGISADRVAVIPHGVLSDIDEETPSLGDVGMTELERLAGQYLLFVGRILPYKGLGHLLRAYSALPSEHRVPLVIAGSGELSAEERDLLADIGEGDVALINRWLTDKETEALASSARFVVLPYLSATQSGVIPLASAFGTPAITSDAGGLSEQVIDGETGLLYRAGDDAALTSALAEALDLSPESYESMSAAALRCARERWDWDALSRELLDFFRMLTARD